MNILEILGRLGFDWKLALMNLVNVGILFVLLKRYLFRPVIAMIDERRRVIKDGVDNALQAKTELLMAERRAQELIDDAKVEANKIVEASHNEAKRVGEQIKTKAKEEIELLIAQAKRNIEIDKKEMKDTLRKETVQIVVLAVEKILSEKLDGKRDTALIQDILSTLK
jgi:F-type H+-transporting ATPase subunit b